MRQFQLRKGDTIAFDYDAPKTGPASRIGKVEKVARSTTKKEKLIVITILDTTANAYRSFHYRNMRNIRVSPAC